MLNFSLGAEVLVRATNSLFNVSKPIDFSLQVILITITFGQTFLKHCLSMSRKYKFRNPEALYFITFTVHFWIDLFTRNEYKNIIIDNLIYCQKNKGLQIFAYCIMTNHVHMVIRLRGIQELPDILRDFKSYSTKLLIYKIKEHPKESRRKWLLEKFWNKSKKGYRIWRGGNHPIELWSNYLVDQKIEYTHNNPVKAGIVLTAEACVYSSARDYAGDRGYLDVHMP